MRVLVSGAAGFVAGYLVRSLRAEHDVCALVRRRPPGGGPTRVEWVEQDLAEPLDHARLPAQVDAVVHLAQSRQYRHFPDQVRDIFAVNVAATLQLLEYARLTGAETFLFASSGGVYGHGREAFVETDEVDPSTFYLSSKYAAELLIATYRPFFRTIVLRPFFVYGPGQRDMLIPALLHKVQHGETITIEGNPGIRINPIYVEDVVRALETALRLQDSNVFNVAGDEVVTITDLVQLLEQVTGKRAVVHYAAATAPGDLFADNSKMKRVLGVQPRISLREGLERMRDASESGMAGLIRSTR